MKKRQILAVFLFFIFIVSFATQISPVPSIPSPQPQSQTRSLTYSPTSNNYSFAASFSNGLSNIPTAFSIGTASGNMIANPSWETGDNSGWSVPTTSSLTKWYNATAEPTYIRGSTMSNVFTDTWTGNFVYQNSTSVLYYPSNSSQSLYPYTGASVAGHGTNGWNNPSSATGATDSVYANVWFVLVGFSNYLVLTADQAGSPQFSLPAGATVHGIQIVVTYKTNGIGTFSDDEVWVRNGTGARVGVNKAGTGGAIVNDAGVHTVTYGSSTDTWTAGLTYSDINTINFGLEFAVWCSAVPLLQTAYFYVDSVYFTVYYGLPKQVIDYSYPFLSLVAKSTVSSLTWYVNGKTNCTNGVPIYLWNYVTSAWDSVSQSIPYNTNSTKTGVVDKTNYMDAAGNMKIRMYQYNQANPFKIGLDMIRWVVISTTGVIVSLETAAPYANTYSLRMNVTGDYRYQSFTPSSSYPVSSNLLLMFAIKSSNVPVAPAFVAVRLFITNASGYKCLTYMISSTGITDTTQYKYFLVSSTSGVFYYQIRNITADALYKNIAQPTTMTITNITLTYWGSGGANFGYWDSMYLGYDTNFYSAQNSVPNSDFELPTNNTSAHYVSVETLSTHNVGTGTQTNSPWGGGIWNNPTNIEGASNGNYASTSLVLGGDEFSNTLYGENFGFSIPAWGVILGIRVGINHQASGTSQFYYDWHVELVKGGTAGGTDKPSGTVWSSSWEYFYYGSSSDLWGEVWSYSDINANNFGIAMAIQRHNSGGGTEGRVDNIQITVYYTDYVYNQYDQWAPTGWTGLGQNGSTAEFLSNNTMSHYWCVRISTLGSREAQKYIYYTYGANLPKNISFAFYTNKLTSANNIIEFRIRDVTLGRVLSFEFGTGAAAIRIANATFKVIHTQIIVSSWYYRFIENWTDSWRDQYGAGSAINPADNWQIELGVANVATAGTAQATFDSVWLGNANHPYYNSFMFSDSYPAAMANSFVGKTTAPSKYLFDKDGLYTNTGALGAQVSLASENRFLFNIAYNTKQYKIRFNTVSYASSGVTGVQLVVENFTVSSWYVYNNITLHASGITYYASNSLLISATDSRFASSASLDAWQRLYWRINTGTGATLTAIITISWIVLEVIDTTAPNAPVVYSPYYGWLDFTYRINLKWYNVTSALAPVTGFQIQYSSNYTFGINTVTVNVTCATLNYTFSVIEGIYYWHIRSIGGSGSAYSAWSTTMMFQVTGTSFDLFISYFDLDGWGVDFDKVQTFINNTRITSNMVTIATTRLPCVINLTVDDFYYNKIITTPYDIPNSTLAINVQLQLVSVTLQSHGLTKLGIVWSATGSYKNVTFYDSTQNSPILLTPGRYVFQGYANTNSWFNTTLTLSATLNRVISLMPSYSVSISYYDLDGYGVSFDKVQTYINGTRYTFSTNLFWSTTGHVYLNITIDDFFYNKISTVWYTITSTPWNENIELQLVSVTLNAYQLSICNVTRNALIKTIPFYDSVTTLLAPGTYTFSGTAWSGAISFSQVFTLAYTSNRVIQLCDPPLIMSSIQFSQSDTAYSFAMTSNKLSPPFWFRICDNASLVVPTTFAFSGIWSKSTTYGYHNLTLVVGDDVGYTFNFTASYFVNYRYITFEFYSTIDGLGLDPILFQLYVNGSRVWDTTNYQTTGRNVFIQVFDFYMNSFYSGVSAYSRVIQLGLGYYEATFINNGENNIILNSTSDHWSLDFNNPASADYVIITTTAYLNPSSITCEAWVYLTSYDPSGSGATYFISKRNPATGNDGYTLGVNAAGIPSFYVYVGGWFGVTADAGDIPLNTWTHVVGTFDQTTGFAHIYINGVDHAAFLAIGVISPSASNLILGRYQAAIYTMDGRMALARIYNRAITATEVTFSYNHKVAQNLNGIVLFYPFGEGTGFSLYDLSGYNHVGTITGATWQNIVNPPFVAINSLPVASHGSSTIRMIAKSYTMVAYGIRQDNSEVIFQNSTVTISDTSRAFIYKDLTTWRLYLNYYDLDGVGRDFITVKTTINGTRMSDSFSQWLGSGHVTLVLSVTDYYNNIIYLGTFVQTVDPYFRDVQLQLVSTTLQSYGLTNVEIFGNVTMSDTFSTFNPLTWGTAADAPGFTVGIDNGRLKLTTAAGGGHYVYVYTIATYATRSTLTVWGKADTNGWSAISLMGTDPGGVGYWQLLTDGANWEIYSRQGGIWAWRATGGVSAANTWYKITVVLTSTSVTITVLNPDGSVNWQPTVTYDANVAGWGYRLLNDVSNTHSTWFDLFVLQGNTGYSKTLTFYDAATTLLTPDDYVFNGTAWNGAIRFQSSATITLTLNRVIKLCETPFTYVIISYYRPNGLGFASFTEVKTYINGSRTITPYNIISNRIGETFNLTVMDYFNNTIYTHDYLINETITYLDVRLQVWSVKVYSQEHALCYVWINRTSAIFSEWLYEVDVIEWYVFAGNYTLNCWYQNTSIPGGGVWANYTLSISADFAILITSNAIFDIYSAIPSFGTQITAISSQIASLILHIDAQYDDISTAMQELNEFAANTNAIITQTKSDLAFANSVDALMFVIIIIMFSVTALSAYTIIRRYSTKNLYRQLYSGKYGAIERRNTYEELRNNSKNNARR